jgi:hypothetical protein
VIRLMTIPQIHTPATCVISCSEFDAQLPALAGLSEPAKATLMVFLQPATRYAVRSSADIEDAGDSAMAGMFLTVLNVEGSLEQIERAVVACWKSVQGEAVQRVEPRPRMAVVVMEQVDSEKAGVLFMANPVTKSVGSWVVTATYGQGEGVVGGTLPVDTYTLSADDKHVLRKSKLAHKTKQLLLKDGGTVEADVPAELQDGSALSEADIRALAAAGQAVRAHTSCPQDIEFAFAKGKLFILQTRPITTLGAHLKWWVGLLREPGLMPHTPPRQGGTGARLVPAQRAPSHAAVALLPAHVGRRPPARRDGAQRGFWRGLCGDQHGHPQRVCVLLHAPARSALGALSRVQLAP